MTVLETAPWSEGRLAELKAAFPALDMVTARSREEQAAKADDEGRA
jgi:hypothetical protein